MMGLYYTKGYEKDWTGGEPSKWSKSFGQAMMNWFNYQMQPYKIKLEILENIMKREMGEEKFNNIYKSEIIDMMREKGIKELWIDGHYYACPTCG